MSKTKTEAKTIEGEVVGGSELARQESASLSTWQAPEWTQERIALAKKQVCPEGTTDGEFEFFLAWSKRTGLDPFIKQSYLVERKAKQPDGRWVTKREPMAAEAGLAARADVMPDFGGMRGGAVYEGDSFEIVTLDDGSQVVKHSWNLTERAKNGSKLVGAWAHAVRKGRAVVPTYLTLASRKPNYETSFWQGDKAAGQLLKCARAEQYRLAFPNVFAGVYIREEMHDDEPALPAAVQPPPRQAARVDAEVRLARATPPPPPPRHKVEIPHGSVLKPDPIAAPVQQELTPVADPYAEIVDAIHAATTTKALAELRIKRGGSSWPEQVLAEWGIKNQELHKQERGGAK